ncbi:MAG: hypothetical protein NZ874_03550, partial [Fimbriimonadales bacterium]|nr:hypothetical protein [Fimbriimonadales bacterium]
EPKATAALRGALRTAPRALPLFQTLRQRPDLHSLVLSDDAPPLEQWLNALHTREHLHQMLQRAETQIKLQPADSPAIRLLVGKLREFARSELDYWRVLARIPHEQATHALLAASGWLSVVGLEHLTTTLDYRLTPLILSVNRQFWTPDLTQLARLGDAAFLPYVLRARHPSLNRYGEPAEVVKSA